ncbi:MAG: sensor histidine kinase [Chitinophagaceae bacterium]
MPQIEKYGVLISCLRILMNSVLMTVVHMALVYGILYFIMPRYLKKNKNKLITTVLLILFVLAIACFNYLNFLMTFSISTWLGYFDKMPSIYFITPIWIRQILFNYPTVVGFAVAIKFLKRWYLKQIETEQLTRENISAELQLLKAQVHPHFLFNTLNNIYSFILNGSPKAPEIIKKLSSLLKYILNECNRTLVPLEKELLMIQDYMELERIRYGDKLNISLHVQGNTTGKMISPLLLIPFVENSFKHGTSQMLAHPWVKLDILIENEKLEFKISNNKPESKNEIITKNGIGLYNVKKRLQLLYSGAYSLYITENEMSYNVVLRISVHLPLQKDKQILNLQENKVYELV